MASLRAVLDGVPDVRRHDSRTKVCSFPRVIVPRGTMTPNDNRNSCSVVVDAGSRRYQSLSQRIFLHFLKVRKRKSRILER